MPTSYKFRCVRSSHTSYCQNIWSYTLCCSVACRKMCLIAYWRNFLDASERWWAPKSLWIATLACRLELRLFAWKQVNRQQYALKIWTVLIWTVVIKSIADLQMRRSVITKHCSNLKTVVIDCCKWRRKFVLTSDAELYEIDNFNHFRRRSLMIDLRDATKQKCIEEKEI